MDQNRTIMKLGTKIARVELGGPKSHNRDTWEIKFAQLKSGGLIVILRRLKCNYTIFL